MCLVIPVHAGCDAQIDRLQRGQAELADRLHKVKGERNAARGEVKQLREQIARLKEGVLHHLRAVVPRIDNACFAAGDTIGQHMDEFNKARMDVCRAIDAAGGRGTK